MSWVYFIWIFFHSLEKKNLTDRKRISVYIKPYKYNRLVHCSGVCDRKQTCVCLYIYISQWWSPTARFRYEKHKFLHETHYILCLNLFLCDVSLQCPRNHEDPIETPRLSSLVYIYNTIIHILSFINKIGQVNGFFF